MSGHAMPAATTPTTGRMGVVLVAIAAAWLAAIVAQWSGEAVLLHHHTLIEHGPPPWIAVGLFLVGWQVMLAAMMLPASLPTIRVVDAAIGHRATFRLAFAATWSVFGLFAFGGDFILHHVVDATPWLAARPWLIEAGVLGMAGFYQLSPFKRRSLAACRHPVDLLATQTHRSRAFDLGVAHAVDCLGSSWALMLLMFAEGFANLWWMAALTGVMVYETTSPHGQRAALAVGVVLLALSVGTLVAG
jgi:predicted metal-binding membrane protein